MIPEDNKPHHAHQLYPKAQRPRRLLARSSTAHWIGLILSVCLLSIPMFQPAMAGAAMPAGPEGAPQSAEMPQGGSQVIGIVSTALQCLSIGQHLPCDASGTVRLTWQGQAERARLVLTVAGTEAAHTIRVNGQAATRAPVRPDGGIDGETETLYLSVPIKVLRQGDNRIELTDDALTGDGWSATDV